jgi:hypothetical protein
MPAHTSNLARVNSKTALVILVAVSALAGGCSSSPPPQQAAAPASANAPATGNADVSPEHLVVGGADSVGAIPGSERALYVYRFKQTDPASDRFTFQDRDLSFYFRPSPTALFFQVENRQDRPVTLEWDRCVFIDTFGSSKKVANSDTRWPQRFSTIPPTQIAGLQRYSNYVFPIDYLVDSGTGDQLHRPLFPEDRTAPQFADREFGVNLYFRVNDRLTPYGFRFKVQSVIPR